MDSMILDINLAANVVKKILQGFVELNMKAVTRKGKYNHIDVTLLRQDIMSYTIQVTNYGQFTNDILSFSQNVFCDYVCNDIALDNTSIAIAYIRNEHDGRIMMHLILHRKQLSLIENTKNRNPMNVYCQKNYLSFFLKHKLSSSDVEKFTSIILDEIVLLQRSNSCTKFTVHANQSIIYNNYIPLDDDYKSCQVLANALTGIIKQSLNIEFKESCFSQLSVENSHGIEIMLMCKLLPLIHDNYSFPSNTLMDV